MSIYDDFFNLEGPCPESIEGCTELRSQYQTEVNKLTADNNCNGCQAINLKAEYQTKVWKAYMNSLIIRA
jgi:hypothetical protein